MNGGPTLSFRSLTFDVLAHGLDPDRFFYTADHFQYQHETMATSVLSRKKGVIVGDDVLKVG